MLNTEWEEIQRFLEAAEGYPVDVDWGTQGFYRCNDAETLPGECADFIFISVMIKLNNMETTNKLFYSGTKFFTENEEDYRITVRISLDDDCKITYATGA